MSKNFIKFQGEILRKKKNKRNENSKCNFFQRVIAHIIAIKLTDFFDQI